MDRVIEEMLHADEDGMYAQLQQPGLRDALANEQGPPRIDADLLAGPFAHLVVDEAQELTDAEWRMLLRRCPSRSLTIVGDRAQARHGFRESWQERLARVGLNRVEVATLTINYRTPMEIMQEAEPVIRAAIPDANVPTSVRTTGVTVRHAPIAQLPTILEEWLDQHAHGIACVIGDATFTATDRVRSLTPELAKGLEFDLVLLVEPERFGTGIEGAVDRYVAMTRATQQLVMLRRP
jgi:superfamily I DNA/RNA helicase